MSFDLDKYLEWKIPSYYICDGTEDGIQEATVDETDYFFYVSNSHVGAIIRYLDGSFYTNDRTMIVTMPTYEEDRELTPEQTRQPINADGYEGSIPEDDAGDATDVKIIYDEDGVPSMFYQKGDEWIKIPLISPDEVEISGGTVLLKSVNFTENGDTVEVS